MTDWREELIEKMAKEICRIYGFDHNDWRHWRTSRAVLEVAEPVIREQAGNALRGEIARLREENAELVMRGYALLSLLPPETTCGQVQEARARLAAIREGGKDA